MIQKQFYLYFLTNWTGSVLYIGVTSDLEKRFYQHKYKLKAGFSKKYNCDRVVYYEVYGDPEQAIKREKQIKKWSRKKKDFLVNKMNPDWEDLSLRWYEDPSTSLGMTGGRG